MTRVSCAFIAAAAAILLLFARPAPGAAGSFKPVEWLVARAIDTGTTEDAPGSRIDLIIGRWSSAGEGQALREALAVAPMRVPAALQQLRRPVGMVQSPGEQGRGARARARRTSALLFAREIHTATARQVVVVTDQYFDFGVPADRRPPQPELVLIDIRLGSDGNGIGKVARGADITHDADGTLRMRDYDAQPVRLRGVRSQLR